MDLNMGGKIAVVTGGSGGIGGVTCKELAREGARVVVVYFRNAAAAEDVVKDIQIDGGTAIALGADVREGASVKDLFEKTRQAFGGLDVLVNCAGVASFHPLSEYPEAAWDAVLDTNLKGAFLCCQAAAPYLQERGGGDIVNVSSLAASTGSYEGGAYAASKAGLNVLTSSLAMEMAKFNVRVNAVAPGRISTPFRRTHSGRYYDFMLEQTPQKRMGTTQEVANAIVFLASRACAFITGETLCVTGGLHTVYLDHVTPDADSKLSWAGVSLEAGN
jgi:NAD(P)-dependent dehydrogenase (short-subunit alcohol dehydrogenase family)